MRRRSTHKHSSCVEHRGDIFDGEPIAANGAVYGMADAYHLAGEGKAEDQLERGMIFLRMDDLGLYAPLTVEMMRALAQQVTLMADIIEGNAARKAADVLNRAGKQGGV